MMKWVCQMGSWEFNQRAAIAITTGTFSHPSLYQLSWCMPMLILYITCPKLSRYNHSIVLATINSDKSCSPLVAKLLDVLHYLVIIVPDVTCKVRWNYLNYLIISVHCSVKSVIEHLDSSRSFPRLCIGILYLTFILLYFIT